MQCEQCNKAFTAKKNLNRHVRAVHDKEKHHECNICFKKFARKQNKELHYKTCFPTKALKLPTLKEVRRTDIPFKPILLKTLFGGLLQQWTIEFSHNGTTDALNTLRDGINAMKATIFEQTYKHTQQLKVYFAAHIVFVKAVNNFRTDPPVVLQTDPVRILLGDLYRLDNICDDQNKQMIAEIDTFERNGSRWTIDHIVRLDTTITKIDLLNKSC